MIFIPFANFGNHPLVKVQIFWKGHKILPHLPLVCNLTLLSNVKKERKMVQILLASSEYLNFSELKILVTWRGLFQTLHTCFVFGYIADVIKTKWCLISEIPTRGVCKVNSSKHPLHRDPKFRNPSRNCYKNQLDCMISKMCRSILKIRCKYWLPITSWKSPKNCPCLLM